MNYIQRREKYIEQMDCNPHRVIGAVTMSLWMAMLAYMKPSVLIEHGCGWSSVVLSKWRETHVPHVIVEKEPEWRGRIEPALENLALWLTATEASRLVPGLTWAALIDGDQHGRARMVRALLPHAAKGIMLLDDANADYVQTAAEPLKTAPGKLWDLKPITFERRNLDTWAWLWVGDEVFIPIAAYLGGEKCEVVS